MAEQLSPEDLKVIEAKIGEVEKTTAAEIVVHVVARSDPYAAQRLGWAVVLGALTAEVLAYQFPDPCLPWALELAAGFSLILWFVFGIPALLSKLAPPGLKGAKVHRRAQAAFIENRVHRTRDATGVLILVSMFERRVEILADEGIHARVGVEGWKAHVRRIIEGMKAGKPVDGIVQTIGLIGAELKTEVPIKPDDENELSNEVVVSRD